MKWIIVSKLKIIKYFSMFLLFATVIFLPNNSKNNVLLSNKTLQIHSLPIYNVSRDDNKIAITFNASWDNKNSDEILNLLNKYDIKSTFFFVGTFVRKFPETVRKIYSYGHEIANHSNNHKLFSTLNHEQLFKEVNDCYNELASLGVKVSSFIRPPSGDYTKDNITSLFNIGYIPVQWDVDSIDWKNPDVNTIISRINSKTKSGSIILFHLEPSNTVTALKEILPSLLKNKYKPCTIGELIYNKDYYINNNGTQIKK